MKPEPPPALVSFSAKLFKTMQEKGAWVFVMVPGDLAPPVTGAWGMTPVIATVEGREWKTTVWKDKEGRSYLPVPKKIRRDKQPGEVVQVTLILDRSRL